MCGIAIHFNPSGQATPLDLELIRHRGPDSSGAWTSPDGHCWLGNTRLAIIDLSPSGKQPMADPNTGNVIVVNGEIYNHRLLRTRLGESVSWQGTSDTETILKGYACWGPDVVPQLGGMFAFALYDAAKKELFLARDRLGIKPFYYTIDANGFRAASEVRLLVRSDAHQTTGSAISGYVQWGACPENNLIYPSIRTIPAGHSVTVGVRGDIKMQRYWPARPAFVTKTNNVAQKLRARIETAVKEHLLSDVPVASFLSGGIDSSIITAIAAQELAGKLQTFSVGFRAAEFDESAFASEVSRRYGTDHHRIELADEEVIESVTEAVEKMDLPSVDAINTYIVARAVAAHRVKVALSGLGGDELFGGYPSFKDVGRLRWIARLPRDLRRVIGAVTNTGDRLVDIPHTSDAGELARWRRRFFTDKMLADSGLPSTPDLVEYPADMPDDFARASWAELSGYMRPMLLRDTDQMSMAVSLELRVPFLDHELVEFVLGLPAREKQRNGQAKGLLVEACRDLLPSTIYQRPKAGFVLPMKDWMRGPLASFVEAGIREAVSRRLIRAQFVNDIAGAFRSGRLHWTRLWSIVVLGHFARRTDLTSVSDENTSIHSHG